MIDPAGYVKPDLLDLVQRHLSWYPHMQVQDVYKLLYQGAMGPEHWISSPQEFTRCLEMEFEAVSMACEERLLEPIRVDGRLLRLNLRAYKAHHQSVDPIHHVLLETSYTFTSVLKDLIGSWKDFVHLCAQGELDTFPRPAIEQFNQWLEAESYPSVHHSEQYQKLYHPAYRLIAAQYLPALEAAFAG